MRDPGALERRASRVAAVILAAVLPALTIDPPAIAGEGWSDVPDADMAVTQPQVDPQAGAEVLLWTIHVQDEIFGPTLRTEVRHELRVKVFNAQGAQEAGQVEIAHRSDTNIEDVAGRTVRPDGSAAYLAADQVFDRTAVKSSSERTELKSFALPSVVPGCILEYRWSEVRTGEDAGSTLLVFRQPLPIRRIDLYVRPLPLQGTGYRFKIRTFNMAAPPFVEKPGGFRYTVLPAVPAWRDEPYMPPRLQLIPWAALYYTNGPEPKPDEIWWRRGVELARTHQLSMQADGAVEAMAKAIVTGSTSSIESADRLDDWCRTNIDNLSDDRLLLGDTDRRKLARGGKPSDTLKRRRGPAMDILHLFAAMCRSVGIDARLTAAADRTEALFDPALGLPQLLDHYCVAIPAEGGWRFYDPSERWLPPGQVAWFMEGESALVLDRNAPVLVEIPLPPPESTAVVRSGRLRLDSDGNAVGTIRSEYRGHLDAGRHEEYDDLSPAARVERFRIIGPLEAQAPQLDSIRIEGADDPRQPIVERATATLEGYAQPAGDRLLVPLSLFECKRPPVFAAPTRGLPVAFPFPWSEVDTVRIEIPDGYAVEALPTLEAGIVKGAARYRASVAASADGRSILFTRAFSFGVGGTITFATEHYASLKGLFDGIQRRDEAVVSLKRSP